MEGDVVTGFGHEVKACALGQASSSIMARHVVGSTAAELREVREQARAILKENADPPDGKWADLAVLVPVRDFKARHASTMLTFDAVVDAIDSMRLSMRSNRSRRSGARLPPDHFTPNATLISGIVSSKRVLKAFSASRALATARPALSPATRSLGKWKPQTRRLSP